MRKFLLILSISALFLSYSQAQTGKDFWFAIPYIDKSHDNDNSDNIETGPCYFRISTGEAGARVTFYHYPTGGAINEAVLHTLVLPANSVQTVTLADDGSQDISLQNFTNSTYNTVLDKGIHIIASNPVTIYYEIGSYNNTDIFALKGKDAVGKVFFPTFQNKFQNKPVGGIWGNDSWESVDIVATEDATTVTIELPAATSGGSYTTTTTVYKTVTTDSIYKGENIIVPTSATECMFKAMNENIYKITNVQRFQNAALLSSVTSPKTWLIDPTDATHCCYCGGKTVYDDWWANAAKIITVANFDAQLNASVATHSWVVNTTTVIDSTVIFTNTIKQEFSSFTTTSVSLDKGETYSLRSSTKLAVKAFDGIRISSDKNIAVTLKDDSALDEVGSDISADVIGDQIIPVVNAGTKYIIPDFNVGTAGMKQGVYIRATEDGTQVNIAGETNPLATLNKGEVYAYYNFKQNDTYKYIYTNNKPVMCFQIAGYPSKVTTITELAGAIIPPVDQCTGSTQAAFNIPQPHGYKIAIISRTQTPGTFKYRASGSAVWTDFYPTFTGVDITGDAVNDWYISLNPNFVPVVGQNYIVKNTSASFHLGLLSEVELNEDNQGTFYGYFSDFTAPELQLGFDTLADGRVQLFAFGGVEGSYEWGLNTPTPLSASCADNYFENVANCSRYNPIVLSATILENNGFFRYDATGTSTCNGTEMANQIQFEVINKSAYFVPLPIELQYFDAKVRDNTTVEISWKTLSETNNEQFIVERSSDGIHFESVAYLQGSGTSQLPLTYAIENTVPGKGVYYYRLKQIDFDGKYTYSQLVVVVVQDNESKCIVYPTVIDNTSRLFVHPHNSSEFEYRVKIISITGICIFDGIYSTDGDDFEIYSPQIQGIYEVVVSSGSIISKQSIIVER